MKRILFAIAGTLLSGAVYAQSCPDQCACPVFCTPGYFDAQRGMRNFFTPAGNIQAECAQLATLPEEMREPLSQETIVYPSPANDVLHISFTGNLDGVVEAWIYDLMGRIIDYKSYNIPPATITFSVGNLPHGMFVCRVRNNGRELRTIFVKQ